MAAVAAAMYLGGLAGIDELAHRYRVEVLQAGGSPFWDNRWYAGSYGIANYGFIFYLLAWHVGPAVVAAVAAAIIPLLYHVYALRRGWAEDIWPAVALTVVLAVTLTTGQGPFLLAVAVALAAAVLLSGGHPLLAAWLLGAALFTNPLGLLCVALFLLADLVTLPAARRASLICLACFCPFLILRVVLSRAFAEHTMYFVQRDVVAKPLAVALIAVVLAGLCAGPRRRGAQVVFGLFVGLCLLTMLWSDSPLGNNVTRFFGLFGVSLLLGIRGSRRIRAAALVLAAVAAFLQLATPVDNLRRVGEYRTTGREFFAPALRQAARLYDPDYRIHVVAPYRHAEAYYLPVAGYPLTRGWFGQLDGIHNEILFRDYTADEYVSWLRRLGVRYIFLPHTRLQLLSRPEPEILAASPEFTVVSERPDWTVYELRAARPLVTAIDSEAGRGVGAGGAAPPARVESLTGDAVEITLPAAGRYLVRVTWSPYWRLERAEGTLRPSADGFLLLLAPAAGRYRLAVHVTAGAALRAVF